MTEETELLDAVFGNDSSGSTLELRARSSKRRFVRSQHQLSVHRDTARGRTLNASEALRIFGWNILRDLAVRTATPVVETADEPYKSINDQLAGIGVKFADAARKFHWSQDSIHRFEQRKQVPFRDFEKLAQGIALDENQLGTMRGAGVDHQLGVRLRTLKGRDPGRFTVSTVLALTEAAWTIRKQFELASLVQEDDKDAVQKLGFVPSSDYGRPMVPTYEVGYDLASRTRELLGIRPVEPIKSLKDLIETRLRVPVIQLEIHSDFAGATIATGARRGIAINLNGDNSNPLVRRMTMAHELGHLLWDPDQSLEKLCVDRYDDIGADNHVLNNVERRANAFAIEFLAPRDAIRNEFQSSGADAAGLERVIRKFGVGRTAITYHLANATHNAIDVSQVRLPFLSFQEWEAVESLAVPVFAPNDVPVSRRGRFAYYVYKAFIAGLISDDTAASLYGCNVTELNAALESTKNYVAPT